MQQGIKRHRFNIFPEMQTEDYGRLSGDIDANGYDDTQPIYLYQGAILDGWNRYRACCEIEVTPSIAQFDGDDAAAINFVMRTNKRRNLTSSQWAAIAVEATEIIAVISAAVETARREKQAAGSMGNQSAIKNGSANLLAEPFSPEVEAEPEAEPTKTEDHSMRAGNKAAELFHTNPEYVRKASKLKEEAPEAFEQVKRGEKTLSEVDKERKKEKREKEVQTQREEIANGTADLPVGVFEVIAIDPPWPYECAYDPVGRRAASPYPEMDIPALMALKPPFADDCVCFLWTTQTFLWDAKKLLDCWGLEYKATIVWDKGKLGLGVWLRMQCEFCLLGVKGHPTWTNTTYRDIISEPRREHSRKPEAFYKMVEETTVGRRLDFFSREKRAGWEAFGNDTAKF